jgi:hypothetical protein
MRFAVPLAELLIVTACCLVVIAAGSFIEGRESFVAPFRHSMDQELENLTGEAQSTLSIVVACPGTPPTPTLSSL